MPDGMSGVTVIFGSDVAGVTVTILPGMELLLVSLTVTKNVEGVVPSAITVDGPMKTTERPAETVGLWEAWNTTVAVCVRARLLSVVSVAVKVTDSAVGSVTWKTTWPLASLVALAVVMSAVVAGDATSATTLPLTGLVPPLDSNVTVTEVPPPVPIVAGE